MWSFDNVIQPCSPQPYLNIEHLHQLRTFPSAPSQSIPAPTLRGSHCPLQDHWDPAQTSSVAFKASLPSTLSPASAPASCLWACGLKTVKGTTWPQKDVGRVSDLIMQRPENRAWHAVGAQKMAYSSSSSWALTGSVWRQVFESHERCEEVPQPGAWTTLCPTICGGWEGSKDRDPKSHAPVLPPPLCPL